jgi:XTP/dITP diphosphohydrolase
MKQIYFITTNNYKFKKFSESVNVSGIEVTQLAKETPEIQANNNREVAEFSAQWAANEFNCPVIKEDVGLHIDFLEGFPGVYLSSIEKQLKTEGFIKLLTEVEDRRAHWEYAIAYCEPGKKPISFYIQHEGMIATEAKGSSGWYVDKLFIPKGNNKTISEL